MRFKGGVSMGVTIPTTEAGRSGFELPPHLARQVWRGAQLGPSAWPGIATGYPALDRELPDGGWPGGGLTEILADQCGIGEMRLLAPALRAVTAPGSQARYAVLVAPPYLPYAPALAAWGIALERVIWVRAAPRDALWAAEQALKHAAVGALLVWLPKVRTDALRRLQVMAQDGRALVFALRPVAAAAQSSPAPLRLLCKPWRVAVGVPPAVAAAALDERDAWLHVELIKRRGPPLAQPLILRLPLVAPQAAPEMEPVLETPPDQANQEKHDVVDCRDAAVVAARSAQACVATAG
jgi:protein ImuA